MCVCVLIYFGSSPFALCLSSSDFYFTFNAIASAHSVDTLKSALDISVYAHRTVIGHLALTMTN